MKGESLFEIHSILDSFTVGVSKLAVLHWLSHIKKIRVCNIGKMKHLEKSPMTQIHGRNPGTATVLIEIPKL